jgi:hypothetical protein
VRAIWTNSERAHELRFCNLSAVFGHYQRDWRVLCPKQYVSAPAWTTSIEKAANAPSILSIELGFTK